MVGWSNEPATHNRKHPQRDGASKHEAQPVYEHDDIAEQGSASPLGSGPSHRSAEDQAVIDRAAAKRRASKRMPRWNLERNGNSYSLSPAMEDRELAEAMSLEALGLTSNEELKNVLETLVKQASGEEVISAEKFTRLLSYVSSVQPRDPVEAMLAVHMAIINDAIGAMSKALDNARNTMQVDSANNALNKLTRTFTEQMSALKKHRSGGPQRIIVERLEVKEGGQAIVGAFGNNDQGSGGIKVNDGVKMTAPSERPPAAARLTKARSEERLEVPFSDHQVPVLEQRVAVERKVPVPEAPAESIAPSSPKRPRPLQPGRINLGPYSRLKKTKG